MHDIFDADFHMEETGLDRVSEINLVHVAIGESDNTNQSLLLYALQKLHAKRVCVIYVHKPPKVNILVAKFPISIVGDAKAKKMIEKEEQFMRRIADKYSELCKTNGASVDCKSIVSENVEKGIVELIATHQIRCLVMGAGKEERHKGGLKKLASSKAKYVISHASPFCEVVFVFKGEVISFRKSECQPSPSRYEIDFPAIPVDTIDDYPPSPPFDFTTWDRVNEMKQKFSKEVSLRVAAERDLGEAVNKVKELEAMYREELKKREELEHVLMAEKEKVNDICNERDKFARTNQKLKDQKVLILQYFSQMDAKMKQLEQKFLSSMELLIEYRAEVDELRAESGKNIPDTGLVYEFDQSEIEEATNNFDASLKIGQGDYGTTYRCHFRQTQVAIKVRHPNNDRALSEFRQEVAILGRIRHPNMVTLMGTCPGTDSLVYEYLPNGSLEDRLNCKGKTPPLTWQTRVLIAADLCSVLMFLHYSKLECIVHGDLKPSNVLLDANFVPKLSDFGVRRLVRHRKNLETIKVPWDTSTYPHVDPEFGDSGVLTRESDVYSFGVLLLRLLTNRGPSGLPTVVMNARKANCLMETLDSSAGYWPFVVADQLSGLALRCCAARREHRADLAAEVWRVLKDMKAMCAHAEGREADCSNAPPYFVCPIFQDVMGDPHVAADGFTYEAEAVKGWFESGHNTSPMTNLKLPHCNLVPNHALRSAIQEWKQSR